MVEIKLVEVNNALDKELLLKIANEVDSYLAPYIVESIMYRETHNKYLSFERLEGRYGLLYESKVTFYRKREKVLRLYRERFK